MHIVVCVKQIQDPEIAASIFRVDEDSRQVIPVPGLSPVISPFDEQAVEAALRIRDAAPDDAEVRITVLTMGPQGARAVLKGALALGADDGVILSDAAFDGADGHATVETLAACVRKLGAVDLVFTGRQAADWDSGAVGLGMAELLAMPALTFARAVTVEDSMVRVERVLDDGVETVLAPLPALVTVSNELGPPRHATMRETMRAAKKPIQEWAPADLGLDAARIGAAGARRVLERLFVPLNDSVCEFVDGATPAEQAADLARRLRDAELV